jgi:SAM-dependent methyltransferase
MPYSSVQTNHPLVTSEGFSSLEETVIGLIHRKAYEHVQFYARDASVLDWGCNNGYGIEILASLSHAIAGLDTALHCIEAARQRLPGIAGRIRFYDGETFPFMSEKFDTILSFQVIEHVVDLESYLLAVRNALKPEGVAIFTTPNRNHRLDAGMKPWNPFHVTEFSPETLRCILEANFADVQCLGLHGRAEVIDVERRRCARARVLARQQLSGLQAWRASLRERVRTSVKHLLPERASAMVRHLRNQRKCKMPMVPYTTNDLWYSDEGIEAAIDLMAICSLMPSR